MELRNAFLHIFKNRDIPRLELNTSEPETVLTPLGGHFGSRKPLGPWWPAASQDPARSLQKRPPGPPGPDVGPDLGTT